MPLREGKDNCMGFVDFETEEEVEKAVSLFDGSELDGSTLKVMNPGGGSSNAGGSAMSFGQPPRDERPPRDNGTISCHWLMISFTYCTGLIAFMILDY